MGNFTVPHLGNRLIKATSLFSPAGRATAAAAAAAVAAAAAAVEPALMNNAQKEEQALCLGKTRLEKENLVAWGRDFRSEKWVAWGRDFRFGKVGRGPSTVKEATLQSPQIDGAIQSNTRGNARHKEISWAKGLKGVSSYSREDLTGRRRGDGPCKGGKNGNR